MKIELRPTDLYIKDIEIRGEIREVINLRNSLAFDEDFIAEMRGNGVRKFVPEDEAEEETTTNPQ